MRLVRLLKNNFKGLLWCQILAYGISLLPKQRGQTKFYLDATEWKIGKFNLHILTLAIGYQGIAIPVYFKVYQHKGVLSQEERIKFMREASQYCPLKQGLLIADPELLGKEWFALFAE
ncbi:MAG: hypothetical protein Fur004_27390 [Thermoflexibacter sp.]